MKIAICDDETDDIEIIKSHIAKHRTKHDIAEFTSAFFLLNQINNNNRFDLIFLDVQMPDSDGWKIAKQLKQSRIKSYIAMVTVMNDYIYNCFDRVDWFAPKPVSMEQVHIIIDKATEKLFPAALVFKEEGISITVTAPEIQYVEVMKNYVYIQTITANHRVRLSLHGIKKILSGYPCFVQIHKSYIINIEHYARIEKNDIVMNTGTRVPLSRNYKEIFLEALEEYGKREFE